MHLHNGRPCPDPNCDGGLRSDLVFGPLLTDEAVRAVEASLAYDRPVRTTVEEFLRYHATEGREALVEVVRVAIARTHGLADEPERRLLAEAEAVVKALVGERT